jgi:tRNA(fMet)-specific endonuclease VapC
MLVLDTDYISVLLWEGTEKALRLKDRFAASGQETVVTIVSYEEQTRGWLASLKGSLPLARQIEKYRWLEQHLRFYCDARILSFNEAAARFQALRKAHRRLSNSDLKIAAIVLSQDATLLSRNLRDFKQIPGLKVEDRVS